VKRGKDEEVNGQGGKRGAPAPHGALQPISNWHEVHCRILSDESTNAMVDRVDIFVVNTDLYIYILDTVPPVHVV